jgi:hypothetical protein
MVADLTCTLSPNLSNEVARPWRRRLGLRRWFVSSTAGVDAVHGHLSRTALLRKALTASSGWAGSEGE